MTSVKLINHSSSTADWNKYEYKPKLNYQRSRWGNLLVRLSDGDSRKLLI